MLQEIGIQVLRAVREAVHQEHQRDHVEHEALVLHGDLGAVDGAGDAVLLPCFGLRDLGADVESKEGGDAADPEHGAPAEVGQNDASCDGGQQVSVGVAALQDAGEHAAPFHGSVFHGERCAHAPLSAHADAEQQAQDEEHGEVGSEAAEQFDGGEEDDVGHQRTAAAVAVGQHAEDQRADRAHGQRTGDGQNDLGLADVEVLRQRVEQKDDDEEVEGVESPAEKAGGDGVPARKSFPVCE